MKQESNLSYVWWETGGEGSLNQLFAELGSYAYAESEQFRQDHPKRELSGRRRHYLKQFFGLW
jgi:hypothetical protein